jgi:hypothetical protein
MILVYFINKLKTENKLKLFENRVLRRIFGLRIGEVTGQ